MNRDYVADRYASCRTWLKALSVVLFACVLGASGRCHAETSEDIAALKSLLQETRASIRDMQSKYEQRIDALESRIQELEAKRRQRASGLRPWKVSPLSSRPCSKKPARRHGPTLSTRLLRLPVHRRGQRCCRLIYSE